MTWLGLDIGGAHLKVADGAGYAASYALHLWQEVARLPEAIQQAVDAAPSSDRLAITMTGELADCFANKEQGVRSILRAVLRAAGERQIRVYLLDGRLAGLPETLQHPRQAASANWLALATYCGRFMPQGTGLLIDIGSTTVDLIPLVDGRPAGSADTDTDRLMAHELVYTGVGRSPICALVRTLPFQGESCPVAQELFATTSDVYLLLDDLPAEPNHHDTADRQPRTKSAAVRRLARMICTDDERFTLTDAVQAARFVAQAQREMLLDALRKLVKPWPHPPHTVVLSGQGEFLGRRLVTCLGWPARTVVLSRQIGQLPSCCAPAHALAVLAAESEQVP